MKTFIAVAMFFALVCGTAAAAASPAVVDRAAVTQAAAITLEDVDDAAEMGEVLRFCAAQGIRVTFFIKGEGLAALPVKEAVAAGHEIGNHGMAHRYWADTAPAAIAAELAAAAGAVAAAAGAAPAVVRPPYSYYGDNFLAAAGRAVVVRGVDTGDWLVDTPEAVAESVKGAVADGSIVNINMRVKAAKAALPLIVSDLKERRYALVTVSELLKRAAAPLPPQPAEPPPAAGGAVAVVERVDCGQPYVALTFDDGGSEGQVGEILDVLKATGVRSTFFLLGEWVRTNPSLVRRMVAEGHEIANHSYSHPRFGWLDAAAMRDEIVAAGEAIRETAGLEGARFFRPPYGGYNGVLTGVLRELGYRALVMWDVDSRDWTGLAAEVMAARVARSTAAGSILLFHLHGANTAGALRELIPDLMARGYVPTTLGRMLGWGER